FAAGAANGVCWRNHELRLESKIGFKWDWRSAGAGCAGEMIKAPCKISAPARRVRAAAMIARVTARSKIRRCRHKRASLIGPGMQLLPPLAADRKCALNCRHTT